MNLDWIVGFIEGEGYFSVWANKSGKNHYIRCEISISQKREIFLKKLMITWVDMAKKCHIIKDDGIAWTLTTKQDRYPNAGLVPYNGWYRFLTQREIARLQGFPDSYFIPSSLNKCEHQFGNAICPNVIEAIGREIENSIVDG